MYELMQSSPADKVALSWWNILYRVVGGTPGSMVNLAAAAALGFSLGQHFVCCTCIFCSALTVEVLVESAKTAAIPRFLVAFTPEAIVGVGSEKNRLWVQNPYS